MVKLSTVLFSPISTEKTVASEETKYCFLVHPDCNKQEIKKALKMFYGVEIIKVNIVKNPAKKKLIARGQSVNKRKQIKKAIVTVKKGVTLDFNAFK